MMIIKQSLSGGCWRSLIGFGVVDAGVDCALLLAFFARRLGSGWGECECRFLDLIIALYCDLFI